MGSPQGPAGRHLVSLGNHILDRRRRAGERRQRALVKGPELGCIHVSIGAVIDVVRSQVLIEIAGVTAGHRRDIVLDHLLVVLEVGG